MEEWDKLTEVPFDSTRHLLSVFVSRPHVGSDEKGSLITVTKGAVEEVLERCVRVWLSMLSTI